MFLTEWFKCIIYKDIFQIKKHRNLRGKIEKKLESCFTKEDVNGQKTKESNTLTISKMEIKTVRDL